MQSAYILRGVLTIGRLAPEGLWWDYDSYRMIYIGNDIKSLVGVGFCYLKDIFFDL